MSDKDDLIPRSPRPERSIPKQPKNFPKVAAAVWEELAPRLLAAGLLTDVDGTAFALLCRDIADIERVEAKLSELDQWVDETPNGFKVQSVWLNIRNRLHADIMSLCKEFGMTPASRSTLKTTGIDKGQPDLFDQPSTSTSKTTHDPYVGYGIRPN